MRSVTVGSIYSGRFASGTYDGNSVWSHDRVVRDFKRALKSGPSPESEYGSGDYDMTNYLYEFMHLGCGGNANYNKYDIMHAHWLKEEETMIPFGPDYFSSNDWEDFGKRFDEIVEECMKKH